MSINTVNEIINDFLKNDQSKLREINRVSSHLTKILLLHLNFEINYCNNQLSTRVRKLEKGINAYQQCVGELFEENTTLQTIASELLVDYDYKSSSNKNSIDKVISENARDEKEELKESFGNLRKGFLVDLSFEDRRKKLYDDVDVLLDSSVEREIEELKEKFQEQ